MLLGRREQRRYFFDRLDNPLWVEPLAAKGFFTTPPSPVINKDRGSVSLPPWPASRYLARMAAQVDGREPVLKAIQSMEQTDNSRVHSNLFDAAAALPPKMAAELVPQALDWVAGPYSDTLATVVGDLIVHLANGGQIQGALELARAALALRAEAPIEAAAEDGQSLRFPPRLRGYSSAWSYRDLVARIRARLTDAGGLRALELFCDLLSDAVKLSQVGPVEGPYDASFVWRPAVEAHEQNSTDGFRSVLVDAVRDTARDLTRPDAARVANVINLLEGERWRIFHRIALYTLGAADSAPLEMIASRVTSRELFDDPSIRHEYNVLLRQRFADLPKKSQQVVLGWVDDGPDLKVDEEAFVAVHGRGSTPVERSARAAYWRRDRLAPIADALPPEWEGRYAELVEELGEGDPDGFPYRSGVTWIGPTSPTSGEELARMTTEELVDFLTVWEPSGDRTTGPSPEGLQRILEGVVADDPTKYADGATQLNELPSTYVRGVLGGFAEATKKGKCFSWERVLWLLQCVTERQGDDRPVASRFEDHDPHWGWTMKQAASLLSRGFEAGPCEIPTSLRDGAWRILCLLSEDPDPTVEHEAEYGGTNMDPATLSINTTRGTAMHAVVKYALWLRRDDERHEDAAKRIAEGFERMPEVRTVLDRHLDTSIDPSLAIRAVYGQWFPWLVLLDASWAQSNAEPVFPSAGEESDYGNAAWETYLKFCQPYDDVLEVLHAQYRAAGERLSDRSSDEDEDPRLAFLGRPPHTEAEAGLAEHLAAFYWRGKLDFGDGQGALAAFYDHAPASLRFRLLEFVGRALSNTSDLDMEIAARLQRLWEWRVEVVESSDEEDGAEELAAFGLWFASGLFDDEWSLKQLEGVLRLAGRMDDERSVAEKLASLVERAPLEVVRIFRGLVRADSRGWGVETWREYLEYALETALRSGDADADAAARELINELGALGYFEFRKLLAIGST